MVSYIVCMFSCTYFDLKLDAVAFQVILGVCEVAKKCLCLGGGGGGGCGRHEEVLVRGTSGQSNLRF